MAMDRQPENSIVRICTDEGKSVGVGFLINDDHVLTCHHVIESAIVKSNTQDMLDVIVNLDFPLLKANLMLKGKVIYYKREGEVDIALLQIKDAMPSEAYPVVLSNEKDLWEHQFKAFGFPRKRSEGGIWVLGKIVSVGADGLLQIEASSTYRIEPGFSGGLVWDESLNQVVGMITIADITAGVTGAFAQSVELIENNWDASLPVLNIASTLIKKPTDIPSNFTKTKPLETIQEKQGSFEVFDLGKIRRLLVEGFNEKELRNLCYYNPHFKAVNEELADKMAKSDIIEIIIRYAEQKELMTELLNWAEEKNAAKYKKYYPDYRPSSVSENKKKESSNYKEQSDTKSSTVEKAQQTVSDNTLKKRFLKFVKDPLVWQVLAVIVAIIGIYIAIIQKDDPIVIITPSPSSTTINTPSVVSISTSTLISTTATPTVTNYMEADVNVLIHKFGYSTDGTDCLVATYERDLADDVYNQLENQLRNEMGLGENQVGLEMLDTPLCKKSDAIKSGTERNADLVIWGQIPQSSGGSYELNFTVVQTTELFEVAIGLQGILPEENSESLLEEKVNILTLVNQGLVEYLAKNNEKAIQWFDKVLKLPELSNQAPDIEAAIKMYKARSKAAIGEVEEAEALFKDILENSPLDDEYLWAHIGLGAIYYAQATTPPMDCALLDTAIEEYRLATQVSQGSSSFVAYVEAKAYYGMGSVYFVKGQVCECKDCFEEALGAYEQALEEYDNRDAPDRYMATVHFGLGSVYYRQGILEEAKKEFTACVEKAGQLVALAEQCQTILDEINTPENTTPEND